MEQPVEDGGGHEFVAREELGLVTDALVGGDEDVALPSTGTKARASNADKPTRPLVNWSKPARHPLLGIRTLDLWMWPRRSKLHQRHATGPHWVSSLP